MWKHPRLRGEDHLRQTIGDSRAETPPLTRGRLFSRSAPSGRAGNTPAYAGKTKPPRAALLLLGNTPAYAGKTWRKSLSGGMRWKHPRLRGEDVHRERDTENGVETPPLTRGRRDYLTDPTAPRRNTPAYAGKTNRPRPAQGASWKHPRLRGEDPHLGAHQRTLQRNTPAYAGKTFRGSREAFRVKKHPRLRGEDATELAAGGVALGNTPAYAGKTARTLSHESKGRKHPRLRGEDSSAICSRESGRETPPLTRGRRHQRRV